MKKCSSNLHQMLFTAFLLCAVICTIPAAATDTGISSPDMPDGFPVLPSAGDPIIPDQADVTSTEPASEYEALSGAEGIITVCTSGCDYTSIQAAIDAASAGDTIIVGSGNYPESLTVDKSITIQGIDTGGGYPFIGNSSLYNCIHISASDVVVSDLKLSGTTTNVVYINAESNVKLSNLTVPSHDVDPESINDRRDGIVFAEGISGIEVTDCCMNTSAMNTLYFLNCEGVSVRNNQLNLANIEGEEGRTQEGCGIWFDQNNANFSGFNVTGNTVTGGIIDVDIVQFDIMHQVYPVISDILISDNTVQYSDVWGIYVGGNVHLNQEGYIYDRINVTVSDNRISDINLRDGIYVGWAKNGYVTNNSVTRVKGEPYRGIECTFLDNFVISNNTVTDCSSVLPESYAFLINEVLNTHITGNTLLRNGPNGFLIGTGGFTDAGNTIDSTNTDNGKPLLYYEGQSDVSIKDLAAAGVYIVSCEQVEVSNVTVERSGVGLGIYDSCSVNISGCVLKGCTDSIMLVRAQDTKISGNTISDSMLGIGMADNTNCEISSNTISECVNSGIYAVKGESNVCISNNIISTCGSGVSTKESVGEIATISGNRISNTTYNGIMLIGSDEWVSTGNEFTDCFSGIMLLISRSNIFMENTFINSKDDQLGVVIQNAYNTGIGIVKRGGNNSFIDNSFNSENSVEIIEDAYEPGTDYEFDSVVWGGVSLSDPVSNEESWVNYWNTTKSTGPNIIGGPYLGGNYWATPGGTGWSQTHADRGDGFVAEPYVFDVNNTDYLPLHMHQGPTPTPTPTPVPIVAEFSADNTVGTPPLTVTFEDLSSSSPDCWEWDFGDGSISSEHNPVHTYTGCGMYTVTEKVSDGQSSSVIRKPVYVVLSGSEPSSSGMLVVQSYPSAATVFINSAESGLTPFMLSPIASGQYTVTLKKDGYKDWQKSVNVKSGSPTVVIAELEA